MLYWSLAPDVPEPVDPDMLMHLLVSKLPMLSHRNGELDVVHPEANTFALLARNLECVERVEDRSDRNRPSVHVFRLTRTNRPPLHIGGTGAIRSMASVNHRCH